MYGVGRLPWLDEAEGGDVRYLLQTPKFARWLDISQGRQAVNECVGARTKRSSLGFAGQFNCLRGR